MDETTSSALPPNTGRYCRKCGYDLRESAGRCPECGRTFDAENPRTYRRKPPSPVARWARRILIPIVILALVYGGFVGWLWWGWRAEQNALKSIGPYTMSFGTQAYPWAEKLLPRRMYFLGDRARSLSALGAGGDITIRGDSQAAELEHLQFLQRLGVKAITDAGMTHLDHLTRLEILRIDESPGVMGKALAHLAAMTQLKELAIGASVDDDGLYYLRNLGQLEYLQFPHSRLSGLGFKHLSGLNRLKSLAVGESPLTDAGLRQIVAVHGIRDLFLIDSQVSDAGLQHLEAMTQLERLILPGNQIEGPGLAHLAKLTHLQWIDLSRNPLTDAAVDPLISVINAQKTDGRRPTRVDVYQTRMTAEGIRRLRAALPKADIVTG